MPLALVVAAPAGVAGGPSGGRVFVADRAGGTVSVIWKAKRTESSPSGSQRMSMMAFMSTPPKSLERLFPPAQEGMGPAPLGSSVLGPTPRTQNVKVPERLSRLSLPHPHSGKPTSKNKVSTPMCRIASPG